MDLIISSPVNHQKQTRRRRRERPGARTRRAMSISRKEGFGIQYDIAEGLELASDIAQLPPFEAAHPSPLRRQTFEQSWQRWKAREAEQKAKELQDLAEEQRRVFGGDVNDDELYNPQLWYDCDEHVLSESTVLEDLPVEQYQPTFRTRSQRSTTRKQSLQLPLFLSSFLSDDADIIRLMAGSPPLTPTEIPTREHLHYSLQSLPPIARDPKAHIISSPLLFPLAGDDEDLAASTWNLITSSISTSPTPFSEPETWILLGDDL